MNAMDNDANIFESLYDRATDYGKTSYELVKLKLLYKTSDVISTFMPHSVVFVIAAFFLLLFNLGLAFWLGEILGHISYGFFVVAAFYGLIGGIIHFFMHNWLKNIVGNYIIKMLLK